MSKDIRCLMFRFGALFGYPKNINFPVYNRRFPGKTQNHDNVKIILKRQMTRKFTFPLQFDHLLIIVSLF